MLTAEGWITCLRADGSAETSALRPAVTCHCRCGDETQRLFRAGTVETGVTGEGRGVGARIGEGTGVAVVDVFPIEGCGRLIARYTLSQLRLFHCQIPETGIAHVSKIEPGCRAPKRRQTQQQEDRRGDRIDPPHRNPDHQLGCNEDDQHIGNQAAWFSGYQHAVFQTPSHA